jgi:hypothetical protein
MIQFWTTWNFIWYSGFKMNLYNLNSSLKASIFTTGLIGGYLVYIYPRKMKISLGDKKYYLPYPLLIGGDLLFHQYPMFDILYNNYPCTTTCVLYAYIPAVVWYNISKNILKGKIDKLYGISMNSILYTCTSVAAGFGLFHHLIKNKK